jgi:hypothetical protein
MRVERAGFDTKIRSVRKADEEVYQNAQGSLLVTDTRHRSRVHHTTILVTYAYAVLSKRFKDESSILGTKNRICEFSKSLYRITFMSKFEPPHHLPWGVAQSLT